MGKVVKAITAIASVVALIPGPWQIPAAIIATAGAIGSSALARRPKAPSVSPAGIDRLQASIL